MPHAYHDEQKNSIQYTYSRAIETAVIWNITSSVWSSKCTPVLSFPQEMTHSISLNAIGWNKKHGPAYFQEGEEVLSW